jgi:hypothetical protein
MVNSDRISQPLGLYILGDRSILESRISVMNYTRVNFRG